MKKKCARPACGKSFLPTRPKQMYCSSQCRTYAFRDRNKAKGAKKKTKVSSSKLGDKIKAKSPKVYDSKKVIPLNDDPKKWVTKERPKPPAGLTGLPLRIWKDNHK